MNHVAENLSLISKSSLQTVNIIANTRKLRFACMIFEITIVYIVKRDQALCTFSTSSVLSVLPVTTLFYQTSGSHGEEPFCHLLGQLLILKPIELPP